MIDISKLAESYFCRLLSKEPTGTQIRIFIENLGMHNAEGKVSYCLKNEVEKSDKVFNYSGFCIYINKKYIPYLKNSRIDLIIDKLEERLTLIAPYVRTGISKTMLLKTNIEEFLEFRINPRLLSHGGKVTLVDITIENDVILKFSGGCNGCSMVTMTLKNGIEKELLLEFPMLNGVKDITDHQRGSHSFY